MENTNLLKFFLIANEWKGVEIGYEDGNCQDRKLAGHCSKL